MGPSVRPSDSWETAEHYEKNGSYICAFWRTISFDKLERLATSLRPVKLKCHANREKYAQGANAIVIELVFEDEEIWIARLRAPANVCGTTVSAAAVTRQTECEVATLRLVRERTTIPVPTVHAYSSSYDNELGMPYIMMSALAGTTPEQIGISLWYPDIKPEDMPRFRRYVESLADCYMQLSTIRFDRIGSIYFDPADNSKYVIGPLSNGLGPFDSAWELYVTCAENMEQHCLTLPDDTPEQREGRAPVLWLYRLALWFLANSPNDRGPFLLSHNHFGMQNTLVAKDGTITGFVDWCGAGAYPAEAFATKPFDFTSDCLRSDPDMLAFHRAFSYALERLEQTKYAHHNAKLHCGRRLSQLHSSRLAYIVSRLYPLMDGPDNCEEETYAPFVADLVLGVKDASRFKSSVVFKEWYACTMNRVKSSPGTE